MSDGDLDLESCLNAEEEQSRLDTLIDDLNEASALDGGHSLPNDSADEIDYSQDQSQDIRSYMSKKKKQRNQAKTIKHDLTGSQIMPPESATKKGKLKKNHISRDEALRLAEQE